MNYIISHKNCMDGVSAAFIMKKALPDFEVFFAEYNNTQKIFDLDLDKNSEVIFTDFSLKREEMGRLAQMVKSIVVLDHHKTAEQELKGIELLGNVTSVFDMNKSGAILAFEFVNGEKLGLNRTLFEYIADRDLWRWKLPYSKQVNEALRLLVKLNDLNSFEDVYNTYSNNIERLKEIGDILVSQVEKISTEKLAQTTSITIHGVEFEAINSSNFQSEIGSTICLAHQKPACIYYINANNQVILSFRSRDNLPDISKVAKHLGGGGHRNAAGAHLPLDKLIDLLNSKL